MLNRIIKFSIQNKLVIIFFTILLIVWGVWSALRLPIDAVPDITNNQVQIITQAPALATQEVEQFVSYPVEQSIANLPDLEEIRSISRFGLSVVTAVFDDKVDIYFARQLINERLQNVRANIPEGVSMPELAPVSTGLGQIYEYVLHPAKGSENKYSAADLRTMQDWIIARQLYGTPGVAEVNSFGGLLKQYEVAVKPDRLKAMNVSIAELFNALKNNNQNTGGAYIDKKPNAYFIRGIGLVNSLEDIGRIVIKNPAGIPVYVSDVAEVRFGSAVRYGAMTRNGEGEVVGGIIMMLKGANSADVVKRVKERLELIKRSLPEDVTIEPYLDRTSLVNRAISTVERNLLEGALIVIFVLVMFLGNIRAGIIVASAIPLSMLFALGLMHVFGVSANLLSLGAIDFGLIVDGSVIIVEATLHHLSSRKGTARLTQQEMDQEVFISASRIRNSAAFGEIIILVVYIPVLTLVGIEGKMFRPMAQTVSFAILGALILSLTYIPMISALLLPKTITDKESFADKMMRFFQRLYRPALELAIRFKYAVMTAAVALTAMAAFIFSRMGGEFIPQLQEGDFAFHCILPAGASLSQSIETSMQASRIIRSFPEVKEVIGKTGSAEVPTDPMPPEASDLIITLKDKSEWTTTKDYNDLARRIEERLEVIPGVFFEANQPIQMRFNELMTGIRQDVAVKIFGENVDTLAALAPKIAAIIKSVKGSSSPQVEQTTGLPQITIQYHRSRIANYGLNIAEVNRVVSTAFAGEVAGTVFENERRFDLVVRLDSASRTSIDDVANLFIPLPNGSQILLSQVADVTFKEGPAQISREDAKRRLVIGFNVDGRDVQSVVKDIHAQLDKFKLPTGYYFTYGGTFENLQKAAARLSIAVPAALLLIFMLLYFTFNSFKQATLIFTAIPMAAIGGVLALLLRGMPFSISAGVGFIALFGVAVLNGIVLISTFNQLEKEGVTNVMERIRRGTLERLRPVLMTAIVASLGFLPMAISTGAGAEVQKPLATVVIGGLISATALTLIVLPLLYMFFTKPAVQLPANTGKLLLLPLLLLAAPALFAQAGPSAARISFDTAYDMAMRQSLQIRAVDVEVQRALALSKTGYNIPNTGVFAENEDLRPDDSRGILKIGVSQSIDWPGLYKARRRLVSEQARVATLNKSLKILELKKELQSTYYALWYAQSRQQLWKKLDSIYASLSAAAVLRVRTGETAGLDSIAAIAKARETTVQLKLIARDMQSYQEILKKLMNTDSLFLPVDAPLAKIPLEQTPGSSPHPMLNIQEQNITIANREIDVAKMSRMPDFQGRFFSQRLYGLSNPFTGFSFTVGIPLLGRNTYKHAIRAAQLEREYQQYLLDYQKRTLNTEYQQAMQQVNKNKDLLEYYESTGLKQAEAIMKAADLSYRAGEISFAELSQFLTQAIDLQRNYLDVLNQYNQSVVQSNYYINR
ncbi:CusA/CzcA family heavy metal efflux RND transporter [Filimonas effusa]|uniref:CusA/CzcA family heavy metal efflux RND transporter n=1 Tax=Filimonas effusa TaxID=2508721 RepID=A0A4Q1DA26_9BACT|nr:CusA/CzcA family heavy metal efflux RND transporter [Filimonas effusa]RXK86221.1 CusA/CzcA family heavy metal efflux RND transporter [Filimonas effusa]